MKPFLKIMASILLFLLTIVLFILICISCRTLIYFLEKWSHILFEKEYLNLNEIQKILEKFKNLIYYVYLIPVYSIPMLIGVIAFIFVKRIIFKLLNELNYIEDYLFVDVLKFIIYVLIFLLPISIFFVPNIMSIGQGFKGMWQSTIFYSFKDVFTILEEVYLPMIFVDSFELVEILIYFICEFVFVIVVPIAITVIVLVYMSHYSAEEDCF